MLLVLLISNGTAKMKLAILPFLYCREFVKNPNRKAYFLSELPKNCIILKHFEFVGP